MTEIFVKSQILKRKVCSEVCSKVKRTFQSTKGEGYVDTGVKVLIAVVVGALVLGGLYALFKGVILPTMQDRVTEMFNYKGE